MKDQSHSRIRGGLMAAMAALGCFAAVGQPSAAVAQQTYYWNGGGSTSVPPVDWSSPNWSLSNQGGGSASWVDGNDVNIGYLGALNVGGSFTYPALINLPNSVATNSVTFGVNPTFPNSENTHYYMLTGSPIAIGNGNNTGLVTIATGPVQYSGDAYFANNVSVAGGHDLELKTTADAGNPNKLSYINTYFEFNGSNSFGNLIVDGDVSQTGRPTATFNRTAAFPAGHNVTLGNHAVFSNGGATIDPFTGLRNTTTVGTVTMNVSGGYLSGGFGALSSNFVQIGSGAGSANSCGWVVDGAPVVMVNGPVQGPGGAQGQGDLVFGSGYSAGGNGVVVLNAQSNYAGITAMKQYYDGSSGGSLPMPLVQLGVNNALPTGTDLSFGALIGGTSGGRSGALDLHGFNQTVNSISTWASGTTNYHGGITNIDYADGTNSGATSTLTVNDTVGNAATFDAVIGKLIGGMTSQINASNGNIALHLVSTNIGSLTLGLAQTSSGVAGTSNTYTGGTIIDGGALYAANGLKYSTVAGSQNSATGTGPVTVNSGAILGGSSAGGAVGMPGTGAVTVNSGASLIPAGPTWASAAAPAFHVLGDLTLAANSTVKYTFDPFYSDTVAVGGALTLPNAGNVGVVVNDLGGLQNDAPLFTFGSLTNAFSPASLAIATGSTPAPSGFAYSFAQNGGEIDLLAPWKGSFKKWDGSLAGGLWDTGTTANFKSGGSSTTFAANNVVVFDDTATSPNVTVAAAGVSPGSPVTFANSSQAYTVSGGAISGAATLIVSGSGQVTLNNSNTYSGITQVSNSSTLTLGTATALNVASAVQLQDTSRLQVGVPMTGASKFQNQIYFVGESAQTGASPVIDTQANNVEISGALNSTLYNYTTPIGFTKQGTGELLLSNAYNTYTGVTEIQQGTVRVNSVQAAAGQYSYSALGSGAINVRSGGTLHIDNIAIGVDQNQTASNLVGYVDLYNGATLKGSGNASYERGSITVPLNYNAGSYSPTSVTMTTVNSTDVFAIKDAVRQYDSNSANNEYGNWNGTTRTPDASKQMTVNVTGPGVIKLQDGGVAAATVFGGQWSVGTGSANSGTLQVGPFVGNATPNPDPNSTGSGGPYGQPLNALGFYTPDSSNPHSTADPDLPSSVTVNAGGKLVVAVDQVNANPNINADTGLAVNGTPNYLRNAVTLNGGAVAASGYEVTFGAANTTWTDSAGKSHPGSTNPQGVADSTRVVAQLGGDFTVGSLGGSVLTYDPVGGDTAGRTVDLLGGSRTVANPSPGWTAGSTITYATNWEGTLIVNANGTTGGAFNIMRTAAAAPVTVTPGASLNILGGATVNVTGASLDANGNYVSTGGTYYPARNNVLKDDNSANAVAISNSGQFNVYSGQQTVSTITGAGTTTVNADPNNSTATSLQALQVSQSAINIGAGATVQIGNGGSAGSLSGNVAANGTLAINSSGTLTYGGAISGAGTGMVTQIGTGRTILTGADTYTGMTKVTAGTLEINNPTSLTNLINGIYGSGANITGGALVLDWTGTDPIATVVSDLISGKITDTAITVHAGRGAMALGWKDTGNQITIEPTYVGDTDLNGTVDNNDLGQMLKYFNKAGGWAQGDFNGNGTVDNSDLGALLANFNITQLPLPLVAGSLNVTAVPEPSTLAMLVALLAATAAWGIRRRVSRS